MKNQHTNSSATRRLGMALATGYAALAFGWIEFNDAFVGTTPCRIRVPGEAGRKFGYGQMFKHIFTALPSEAGGYTQTKDFPKGSEIPEHLFFDMRLSYR
jgi:hypothetical protein